MSYLSFVGFGVRMIADGAPVEWCCAWRDGGRRDTMSLPDAQALALECQRRAMRSGLRCLFRVESRAAGDVPPAGLLLPAPRRPLAPG